MRLELTKGKSTLVDKDTFEIVKNFKWHTAVNSSGNHYASRNFRYEGKNRGFSLHHFVAGFPLKGYCVDHKNGDSLDNRRSNLRVVSFRENCCNTKRHRAGKFSSKYPGVTLHQGFWKCQVCVGGFSTEIEAAQFRNELVKAITALKEAENGTI